MDVSVSATKQPPNNSIHGLKQRQSWQQLHKFLSELFSDPLRCTNSNLKMVKGK